MAPKKKNRTQEKVNNEAQEMSHDSDYADELKEMEEDDDNEPMKETELNPTIKEVKERVKEAEERISGAEDEIVQLSARANSLETQVKKLTDKVDDMENRNRRNNVRLVGLPEKEDMFLEAWIPKILEMDSSTLLVIERAHRVGPQRNKDARITRREASTPPRTLIMKFLNFRQKEQVLRVARSKGVISYKEHTLRFYPDVSAEVHKKQKAYNGVRQKLRERGIGKHRVIYPARLLLTHQEKSRVFDTPAAVENFIEELDTE
ncbi:hypothetical protein QQF64_036052 [Cirrhinus molitorella]|uniref:L1 transposable element RRM domain-containing protein n=1 Tax=Cirrhinus molitorella TaxID=172907 RepID=A0ABR3NHM8_9TELE